MAQLAWRSSPEIHLVGAHSACATQSSICCTGNCSAVVVLARQCRLTPSSLAFTAAQETGKATKVIMGILLPTHTAYADTLKLNAIFQSLILG